MSTETIYGGWDKQEGRVPRDELEALWHKLAAQNVGRADFEPNSGLSQRKHEIIELWQLYLRAKPRVVVEVGVAQGGTSAAWCYLGRRDATIIGIDRDVNDCRPRPNEPVHPDIYAGQADTTLNGGGMYRLARYGQRVIPINGWTDNPSTFVQLSVALEGRTIDWCYHDASHEAGMFERDFSVLWPLISPGGAFASHDIQHSIAIGVTKSVAWYGIKREADYSALYEWTTKGGDSMGNGVLIK